MRENLALLEQGPCLDPAEVNFWKRERANRFLCCAMNDLMFLMRI